MCRFCQPKFRHVIPSSRPGFSLRCDLFQQLQPRSARIFRPHQLGRSPKPLYIYYFMMSSSTRAELQQQLPTWRQRVALLSVVVVVLLAAATTPTVTAFQVASHGRAVTTTLPRMVSATLAEVVSTTAEEEEISRTLIQQPRKTREVRVLWISFSF
jgi:anti-sigma-K factor RskA